MAAESRSAWSVAPAPPISSATAGRCSSFARRASARGGSRSSSASWAPGATSWLPGSTASWMRVCSIRCPTRSAQCATSTALRTRAATWVRSLRLWRRSVTNGCWAATFLRLFSTTPRATTTCTRSLRAASALTRSISGACGRGPDPATQTTSLGGGGRHERRLGPRVRRRESVTVHAARMRKSCSSAVPAWGGTT